MKLRVAQFNVENLFLYLDLYKGEDLSSLNEDQWQSLSYATTANKPLRKTFGVADAIKDLNPDILCLNEIGGPESLKNFNTYFLEEAYTPYIIEGNSERGIDVGYLVKKSLPLKYLHLSHRNRPINFLYPHEIGKAKKKSHFFSRDISELRIFNKNPNSPELIILLVHLKSKLDPLHIDFQGQLRRQAELETLVDVYNEIKSGEFQDKIKVIVAGDFNGHASSENTDNEFKFLHSNSDLIDSFDTLNLSGNPDLFTQAQVYQNGKKDFVRIDYIFTSENFCQNIIDGGIYKFKNSLGVEIPTPSTLTDRDMLPSDHYPIYIDIQLK